MKRRITLDFDGVIHSYTTRWESADKIPDPPVRGAFDAIERYLNDDLRVAILSVRSRFEVSPGRSTSTGIVAMRAWFERWGFKRTHELEFPLNKQPSLLYVDDRAWQFDGTTFPSPDTVRNFKPWNK